MTWMLSKEDSYVNGEYVEVFLSKDEYINFYIYIV